MFETHHKGTFIATFGHHHHHHHHFQPHSLDPGRWSFNSTKSQLQGLWAPGKGSFRPGVMAQGTQKINGFFLRKKFTPTRSDTPPKTNMNTQNDGLERVTPLQNGNSWYLCWISGLITCYSPIYNWFSGGPTLYPRVTPLPKKKSELTDSNDAPSAVASPERVAVGSVREDQRLSFKVHHFKTRCSSGFLAGKPDKLQTFKAGECKQQKNACFLLRVSCYMLLQRNPDRCYVANLQAKYIQSQRNSKGAVRVRREDFGKKMLKFLRVWTNWIPVRQSPGYLRCYIHS